MLKFHVKKIPIRIFSFLFAVLIVFLSPCSKYIDATSIDNVYAADWAVAGGGVAADAVLKFLIGLFGTVAAKEAYETYEDEVNQAVYDYMSAPSRWFDVIEDTCVKVYDKASNKIQEISWEDMLASLAEGHDQIVDDLTDLYVQFCPELLMSFEDFISDVLNGDVYIPGFSDVLLMDDTFSDYELIQNVDGSYNISGYASGLSSNGEDIITYVYSGSPISKPYCVLNDFITFYTYNGVSSNSYYFGYKMYRNVNLDYSGSSTGFMVSAFSGYGFNFPIFASQDAAEAAFRSDDYTSALNYLENTMESVIDLTKIPDLAPDIPPFTRAWQQTQWGEVQDVIDFGGIIAGDYADDLPFWGLSDLDELAQSLQDIFEKVLEGIFEGTDVIEFPTTYDDVWDDVWNDVWDRVKDGALDVPVDDTGVVDDAVPYPWEKDDTANPDIDKDTDTDTDTDIDTDIDSDIDMDENDYKVDLRGIFPFCIPFDFVALLNVLDADPVAPRFDFPVVIPALNYQDSVVLDMSMFDDVAKVIRICEKVSFVIFLMFATSKVIRW